MENNKQIIDNLKKYGLDFQIKCIACLLSDRSFMERIQDIVEAEFFESDAQKWILKESIKYFNEYKDLPTLTVFKIKVDSVENEVLKKTIVDNLKLVYQKLNDNDLKFVKEQFLEFCKNQKLKNAIFESADLLALGQYEKIKNVVDHALKAGMERNIGHDYGEDVEKRMSVMCRNCIKTNWTEIDTIMDGGLGPGELGIITACAGSGKCVGPNTEIEIEYHEFGIETTGNSGNPHILWINPLEKYKIDDVELYGWQVENVFFELESLKQNVTSTGSDKII
jgi:hypothetical protein